MDPYAPPKAELRDADAPTGVEALRISLIGHERQLKSVGSLYLLGAILMTLGGTVALVNAGASASGIAIVAIGLALGALGIGFYLLRPWVRIPGGAIAAIGMLAIPVGTLMGAYVLYVMFCKSGRTILAPPYRAVIRATPHVKYRRTIGDWIALGLVIAVLLALILSVVTNVR